MISVETATALADETQKLRQVLAGTQFALRDAREANDALRRENDRLRKVVRLMATRAEVHALELKRAAEGDI